MSILTCSAHACTFPNEPTTGIVVFECVALLASFITIVAFMRYDRWAPLRAFVMMTGVLTFELFTSPLWNNYNMGSWAYLYKDVSWVLTVGWTALIYGVVTLVERFCPSWKELKRYLFSISILTVITFLLEGLLISLDIRSYAPEVLEASGQQFIPFSGIPLGALYYIPVFLMLTIGFYNYISSILAGVPQVPVIKLRFLRWFAIVTGTVLLLELLLEPTIIHQGFPAWTYVYRDVNGLEILLLAAVVSTVVTVTERLLLDHHPLERFFLELGFLCIILIPAEAWVVHYGYQTFSPSTQADLSGIVLPGLGLSIEATLACPFCLALLVGTLRYWQTVFANEI